MREGEKKKSTVHVVLNSGPGDCKWEARCSATADCAALLVQRLPDPSKRVVYLVKTQETKV